MRLRLSTKLLVATLLVGSVFGAGVALASYSDNVWSDTGLPIPPTQ